MCLARARALDAGDASKPAPSTAQFENFDAEAYYWPCYIIGNVLMFGGIAMLTPTDVFNTPKDVAVDGAETAKPRGNKIQPIEEPSSPQPPVEPRPEPTDGA